jgi:hypothetical protein
VTTSKFDIRYSLFDILGNSHPLAILGGETDQDDEADLHA